MRSESKPEQWYPPLTGCERLPGSGDQRAVSCSGPHDRLENPRARSWTRAVRTGDDAVSVVPGRGSVGVGRHSARPGPGPAVRALSAATGALMALATMAGLDSSSAASTGGTARADVFDPPPGMFDGLPTAGPLVLPSIGVVVPDFDERYTALMTARATAAAPRPANPLVAAATTAATPPPRPDPYVPLEVPPVDPPPTEDPAPTEDPPPREDPPPTAPEPTAEQPAPPSAQESSAEPSLAPREPETPPTEPPTETPPAGTPPAATPPAEPPPDETPPAEEPPTEQPPTGEPEPPADTLYVFGEGPSVVDPATGETVVALVLDAVVVDLPCTATDPATPPTGHLVGLRLTVTTGPDLSTLAEPPAVTAADFSLVGEDGVPLTELGTAAAQACLAEGAFPTGPLAAGQTVPGMLVLEVPGTTGTVVYRPAFLPAAARWQV